jgi:cell division transport system permease protein
MMKFLKQSFRNANENLLRNKLVNLLCLGIISFTLLVLGLFRTIALNLDQYISKFKENIEAVFYIKDNTMPAEIAFLLKHIQENLLIKDANLTSSNEAQTKFLTDFPELKYVLSEFPNSPFPASIDAHFRKDTQYDNQIKAFLQDIQNSPIVESIQVNVDWAEKINNIKRFISFIGIFISFILIFISAFIIFNVIKLNIIYREDEITIYKLVGATNWYIRTPFLFEGFLLGFSGSILASFLLIIISKLLPLYASSILDLIKGMIDFHIIPFTTFLQLVLIGSLIGFLSSIFSLKRFLK